MRWEQFTYNGENLPDSINLTLFVLRESRSLSTTKAFCSRSCGRRHVSPLEGAHGISIFTDKACTAVEYTPADVDAAVQDLAISLDGIHYSVDLWAYAAAFSDSASTRTSCAAESKRSAIQPISELDYRPKASTVERYW